MTHRCQEASTGLVVEVRSRLEFSGKFLSFELDEGGWRLATKEKFEQNRQRTTHAHSPHGQRMGQRATSPPLFHPSLTFSTILHFRFYISISTQTAYCNPAVLSKHRAVRLQQTDQPLNDRLHRLQRVRRSDLPEGSVARHLFGSVR